jgi:hypothetical protein
MLKSLFKKTGRYGVAQTVRVDHPSDAIRYSYWIEKQPLRLLLPVGMLRMQGAFAYDQEHPFVQALSDGPERLADFYTRFRPANLRDMYKLPSGTRAGETLPPWELPWVMRLARIAPYGERGLSPEDGVSFYGPTTGKKIEMEYHRLRQTAASIRSHGYQPDRYRDIEGHLMTDGRETCFFVRGGKHRAAVLAWMGVESVPVQFRRTWPLVVDSRTCEHWPLVADGVVDAGFAREILTVYMRGSHV